MPRQRLPKKPPPADTAKASEAEALQALMQQQTPPLPHAKLKVLELLAEQEPPFNHKGGGHAR